MYTSGVSSLLDWKLARLKHWLEATLAWARYRRRGINDIRKYSKARDYSMLYGNRKPIPSSWKMFPLIYSPSTKDSDT